MPRCARRLGRLCDAQGGPARGRYRGIGVANYVEITSGAPRERTEITVLPEGRVELVMGTMSSAAGARDKLRPARHRMARRAVRQHRLRRARHRARRRRRRLAFRPLDADRRLASARRPTTSSSGAARSPAPVRGERHRYRIRALACLPSRAPTAESAFSMSRTPRPRATTCRRNCAARSTASATKPCRSALSLRRAGLRGRDRSRDRRGRDRAVFGASMMSAARSIR